jgi:hypothetical protein
VVIPKGEGCLTKETKIMLKGLLPEARFSLQPAIAWDSRTLLDALDEASVFGDQGVPPCVQRLLTDPQLFQAALSAFASMHEFLRRSLMLDAVFRVGSFEFLSKLSSDEASAGAAGLEDGDATSCGADVLGADADAAVGSTVNLDASALSNLEVRHFTGPM